MVESRRPVKLKEALEYRKQSHALPFAGGTDLMVRQRGYTGTGPKFDSPILFVDAIDELKTIAVEDGELCIGAAVTLTDILAFDPIPTLIRQSIHLIAAPGLRNIATLGGNLCNASPAGDSIPPLYVHEAHLCLKSISGERRIPVDEFFTGPGSTVLKDDEILTQIRIPVLPDGCYYYRKVGTRKANALSKLSIAGYALKTDGKLQDVRIAIGAVAPTVVRMKEAEKLLLQNDDSVLDCIRDSISPISDQRSTAQYRKNTAVNACREFINTILNEEQT